MNIDKSELNNLGLKNLLIRLLSLISNRRRKHLFLVLILTLLSALSEIASIGAVLPFLGVLIEPDRIFNHHLASPIIKKLGILDSDQLILFITIFFIAAIITSGLLRFILLFVKVRVGGAIGTEFSTLIFKKTIYQPYSVHISRNSSQVISGLVSKSSSVIDQTIMPLLNIVSSGLALIFILIFLLTISPTIAFAVFSFLGSFYVLIAFITRKKVNRNSSLISEDQNILVKTLQEGLGGMRDILINGTQDIYCDIYNKAEFSLRRSHANISLISSAPRYIIESVSICFIAILAFLISDRNNSLFVIPLLATITLGVQRIFPLLQELYYSWISISGNTSSLRDVLKLLEQSGSEYSDQSQHQANMEFKKTIEMKGVGFRYTKNGAWTLRGVNFKINKGACIGIVGISGSGKSTFLDLMMGLLKTSEGSFMIDGILLNKKNMSAWRKHISHVPQNIFLADSSVAENIAFGIPKEKIDMERMQKAAMQAQISTTIESWSHQYETIVGERGIRLSGGQRQRIAIARALYKGADVFIFDEATSALDSDTENLVMDAIENISKEITIFMVAHRVSTLKNCDLIFELMEGKIKKVGKPSSLIGGK
jgi:ATP-binding cassette subfamily B protein